MNLITITASLHHPNQRPLVLPVGFPGPSWLCMSKYWYIIYIYTYQLVASQETTSPPGNRVRTKDFVSPTGLPCTWDSWDSLGRVGRRWCSPGHASGIHVVKSLNPLDITTQHHWFIDVQQGLAGYCKLTQKNNTQFSHTFAVIGSQQESHWYQLSSP